jgi:hypothetical protein
VRALRLRRPALRRFTWERYYRQRLVLTVVLVMFYLYPQVTNNSGGRGRLFRGSAGSERAANQTCKEQGSTQRNGRSHPV